MPEEDGWTERQTGTLEDGKVITFREGTGIKTGQTLVGGGQLSAKGLDENHDHYGRELAKANDRGNLANAPNVSDYTSPDYQPTGNQK